MSENEYRGEQCPLPNCEKIIGEGHWLANPGSHSFHAYHTDSEGIARHWEHIDGLDVTPETDPFDEGTAGRRLSIDTDE